MGTYHNSAVLLSNFRYTDTILTNLLAVKSDLCGKKFELRIDDVLFVGFPVLLQSASGKDRKDQPAMTSFNFVFALRVSSYCKS